MKEIREIISELEIKPEDYTFIIRKIEGQKLKEIQ